MKYPKDFWHHLAKHCGYHVQAMARHLGISVRQLERLCQQDLHLSPSKFCHSERMFLAADLLVKGDTVKCVALQLGYTQLSNFSRDFKCFFGCTPREYIDRFRPPPDLPGLTPRPTPSPPLGSGPAGVSARELPRRAPVDQASLPASSRGIPAPCPPSPPCPTNSHPNPIPPPFPVRPTTNPH